MLPLAIFFGSFALFGWGITDFLAALTSRKIGNVSALSWVLVGGLTLMTLYFFATKNIFTIPAAALVILCISGIFQTLGGISFYKALEIGKVSLASPIGSSFSVWTVLLSVVFLGERLTPMQIIAILSVIVGTFCVSSNFALLKKDFRKSFTDKGVFLALLASILWGISFVIYSPILKTYGWLPSVIGLRFFEAITVLLFGLIFKQKLFFKPHSLPIIYLVIMSFTDVFAYFGYSIGLQYGLTALVSPVAAAFPLVTVLLARIILKEKIVANQFFGILAIIGGVILISL